MARGRRTVAGDGATDAPRQGDGPRWTRQHASTLRELQTMSLEPTRFANRSVLRELGLEDDLQTFFETIGMEEFFAMRHPLYPSLAREFLASCSVTYEDPAEKNPAEGKLSFFLERKYYELPLYAFGDIYGFPHHSSSKLEKFEHCKELWSVLAGGHYTPRGAKISHIRNPVIRFAAKIISNTLFFKAEPGAVREDEMTLIYHGIRHLVPEIACDEDYDVSLAAVLAELLEGVKSIAFRTRKAKKIQCGTILTPLFIYLGIDLSGVERDDRMSSIDLPHLRSCQIMTDDTTYNYYNHEMANREVQLPLTAYTTIISRENLEFHPQTLAGNFRPRRSVQERSTRASASTRPRRSAHIPRTEYREAAEQEREDSATEQEEFDPYAYALPLAPSTDDAEATGEWMVQATQRHHSMMQRFLSTITMGCFAGSSRRRTRSPAAWERTRTGHSPDQAADDTQSPEH